MNRWYNRINGSHPIQPIQQTRFQNPIQQANYIMQAMRNPAAFVQNQFPDIPENIRNNPNEILNYLQRTRGSQLSNDIQNIYNMNIRK
jgi:hypothetical protein